MSWWKRKELPSSLRQTRNRWFCLLNNYVKWRGSSGAIRAKLQGSELAEVLLDVVLETPRLIVLGVFMARMLCQDQPRIS